MNESPSHSGNLFVVRRTAGKYNGSSFYLIEVKPEFSPIKKIKHKPNKQMLVLKEWRNCYMGKEKSKGYQAERESEELMHALRDNGFESARALYVAGVFDRPHEEIMRIITA